MRARVCPCVCRMAWAAVVRKAFGIPCDGSRQWLAYHNVVGLHVWLVYRRVKAARPSDAAVGLDVEEANVIGQELYDRFWEDAIERVRETRVSTALRHVAWTFRRNAVVCSIHVHDSCSHPSLLPALVVVAATAATCSSSRRFSRCL
jgi:hypothetical protein